MTVPTDRDGLVLLGGRRRLRERTRPANALPALMVIAVLLTACGNDDDDSEPSDATAPTQSSSPSATPEASPTTDSPTTSDVADESADTPSGFPKGTGPKNGMGSGKALVFTDIRVADHDGFDRIVLEFTGAGSPGWSVNYSKKAMLDGSGKVVDLDGDSTLNIFASNTTWPDDAYYSGPKRLAGGNDVPDVHVGGTFEGYTQILVGLDGSRAPFRVSTLTKPSRLVVDVVDAD